MIGNSLIETTRDIFFDIYAVSKNINTLPLVMSKYSENDKYEIPSNEKYQAVYDMVEIAHKIFISEYEKKQITLKETFKSPMNSDKENNEKWFFINGIMTSEIAAKVNAKALACIFDRDIHLIYNPTNSLFNDILKCISGRAFNSADHLTTVTYFHILNALKYNKKVVLFAYSQGGIIASQVVMKLMQDKNNAHLAKKLELYTFGNATNRLNINEHAKIYSPHIEHFANTKDFIAQISILHYKERIAGNLFTHDTFGHFLNIHYLQNLIEGNYGKDNHLYDYIKNDIPKALLI